MAKAKVNVRDVSPLLQMVRNFLLGRKHNSALRWSHEMSCRSPPLPELPEGPAHKLNTNYYYARDARREVTPPLVIVGRGAATKEIAAGDDEDKVKYVPTPGKVYQWD